MMNNKMDAPAFQEYAANLLSNRNFRLASLSERGLIFTMRLECWVNKSLPSDTGSLAHYLGLPEDEVRKNLTKNVLSFFEVADKDFKCPLLDDYRSTLDKRREAQANGGKKGSAITNDLKRRKSLERPSISASNLSRHSASSSRVLNIEQNNTEQNNKYQSLEGTDISIKTNDQWINDYEDASNGM